MEKANGTGGFGTGGQVTRSDVRDASVVLHEIEGMRSDRGHSTSHAGAHSDCGYTASHTCAGSHSVRGHSTSHEGERVHHHHSHAAGSRHDAGHHLLQVADLSVGFRMYDADGSFLGAGQATSNVIENLSISVHVGEIVAVVGASGSGKTLLADSIMGLFEPNAQVTGEINFQGEAMDAASLARVRGRAGGIALVPQGVAHLDPLMRVGEQVEGPARGAERRARAEKRRALFERYDLDESVARMYPFELSGGMARRVLLCCALIDDPVLIIADEPTPGLDLDLAVAALSDLRAFADEGGGVMLITHDIELALRVADRIAVFRDGTIVEETAVANFASPDALSHPFSRALWHAMPEHDFASGSQRGYSRLARLAPRGKGDADV